MDLRSVFGGDLGRHLIQNNRSLLTVRGGAVFTRERFTGPDPGRNNIEGTGTVVLELFRFDDPEMDITTTFTVLPSFSDWGRIRADLDTRIRYELFKDFFWSVSAFDQYDSAPPQGTETNDFGVNTSVGWSF